MIIFFFFLFFLMIDPKKLLKQLRTYERFRSLTKAIQMVALSQLSSLKTKIDSRQYALSAFKPFFTPIFDSEVGNEYLVVPICVDKSCCGPHNGNIFKATKEVLDELKELNYSFKIISIGKRAKYFFQKYYKNYQVMNIWNIDREPLSLFVSHILAEKFFNYSFDYCYFIFNRFYSAFKQRTSYYKIFSYYYFIHNLYEPHSSFDKISQLFSSLINSITDKSSNFLFFIKDFFEYGFSSFFLDALEENEYSSLGARATAMNNATKNAGDIIENLRLRYNKARQEQITNELIEIVSAVNFC